MRPEIKAKLDTEQGLSKNITKLLLAILVVSICALIFWIRNPNDIIGSNVTGLSVNKTALLHDEGHTNILFVKLDNTGKVVRVFMPNSISMKLNRRVQLRKLEKKSSTRIRYRFLKYIDS